MLKYIMIGILQFLLSSCFSYYNNAERLAIMGIVDNDESERSEFNIGKSKNFDLVYLINGDTVDIPLGIIREDNRVDAGERVIKSFSQSFCNVAVPASDVSGCGQTLRGIVDIEIVLKNKETKKWTLLAKKSIDMDAYVRSVLLTQVYVGSDTAKYLSRSRFNIDWSKMKPIVFEGSNDTLYHHTGWYWDKREKYENNLIEDQYFVEIP